MPDPGQNISAPEKLFFPSLTLNVQNPHYEVRLEPTWAGARTGGWAGPPPAPPSSGCRGRGRNVSGLRSRPTHHQQDAAGVETR